MRIKYITLYEETSNPYPNGSNRIASSKKRRFKESDILPVIIGEWEFDSLDDFLDVYDDSHLEYLKNRFETY